MPRGINSSGISEGGVSNNTPGMSESPSRFSNITEAPAQGQPALPDPISQKIQQPYILNGLTYQSNNPYIIERDGAGNIKLQESASNQRLIIEPSIEHITNQSFVQVVNTQFKYFKFPAKVNITGTEGLDIDIPSFSYDKYEGRLLRDGDTLWIIKDNLKRLFYIRAASTWAIRNNLPPFENITGDIPGLNNGENNYSNYNNVTYERAAPTVLASYKEGPAYTWLDAFPDGEDRYSKFHFIIGDSPYEQNTDNGININGPGFSTATFGNNWGAGDQRVSEFNTDETRDSYIGLDVWGADALVMGDYQLVTFRREMEGTTVYREDLAADGEIIYTYDTIYLYKATVRKAATSGTFMKLEMKTGGNNVDLTHKLRDGNGDLSNSSGYVIFPSAGENYTGWVLRMEDLVEKLKNEYPSKMTTVSGGHEQIKGNQDIAFELSFLDPDNTGLEEETQDFYFVWSTTDSKIIDTVHENLQNIGRDITDFDKGGANISYDAGDTMANTMAADSKYTTYLNDLNRRQ